MSEIYKLYKRFENAVQRYLGFIDPQPDSRAISQKSSNRLVDSVEANSADCPRGTIFVNDVSVSMSTNDCQPSRLEASKKAAIEYVKKRGAISGQDSIAVVSFCDYGKVILPLTEIGKSKTIIKAIKSLETGGATDIAEGLRTARDLMFDDDWVGSPQQVKNKHILMLTDGNGGHPIRVANELKRKDVLIEIIGVGKRSEVNSTLLRKVATTDSNGFTHYWFINDPKKLADHYRELATGIVKRD